MLPFPTVGTVQCSVRLAVRLESLFAFFSDAHNLESLTPPWLRFKVLTPGPIPMQRGTVIDYRLRIRGFPIRWRSRITAWEPPHRFVDEQVRGPYRKWVHEHRFERQHDATGREVVVASDHVDYSAPGGRLIERFLVAPDVEQIFAYRSAELRKRFGAEPD